MNVEFKNMDEYARDVLSPLRDVAPLDAASAAEERKKFLLQGELFRAEMQAHQQPQDGRQRSYSRRPFSLMKALVGALIALLILVGSSATVFASQSALPGEPLYVIKSLSEDMRLTFATSPQDRLELTLTFTNRRMSEIKSLMTSGKDLPDQASQRFAGELETALNLASAMEDPQMHQALGKIKNTAKSQGMTLDKLIDNLPDQADPALAQLQVRLQEQVQLSDIGEADPISFRAKMHARQNQKHGAASRTPTPTLPGGSITTPDKPGKGNQNNGNQDPPGQDHQGNATPGGVNKPSK